MSHLTSKPLISVIIPTHLRPKLLSRALASIAAQSVRDAVEIIVISDVRDPATSEICNELLTYNDIFVSRNGLAGPSASRNIGIGLARGHYLMFLDDDDAWYEDFVHQLISKKNELEQCLHYFDCAVIKESRLPGGPIANSIATLSCAGVVTDEIYVKNQIHMSCMLFPSNIARQLQFDTSMRAYEDWDFVLSALDISSIKHIPIMCSKVYEVDDESTDRRGSSADAQNFNAVLDYLYVYRRHKSPTNAIAEKRHQLLSSVGLSLATNLL
jgi:GalNAc5-diNAcBac-PP-undecaprenol beta-1,3-glucosyltransferase